MSSWKGAVAVGAIGAGLRYKRERYGSKVGWGHVIESEATQGRWAQIVIQPRAQLLSRADRALQDKSHQATRFVEKKAQRLALVGTDIVVLPGFYTLLTILVK